MSKNKNVKKEPVKCILNKGDHYWCTCGHSASQPFCDGSHLTKAPEYQPLKFSVEEKKEGYLCQCKESKTAPYCDGTHNTL